MSKKLEALPPWFDQAAAQQELEYLRYFYQEADFGPADGDVRMIIRENYTGVIPEGYGDEE